MRDCGCEYNHGQGVRPSMGPCCKPIKEELPVKVATITYQPQYGTEKEGPYTPVYGQYTNTLVHYLANDAIVFYDGEGAWTLINSDDKLDTVKKYLQEQINTEVTNRTQADKLLQEQINTEVTNRTQADELLQENINKEVMAREQDRDNLQTNINNLAEQVATETGRLDSKDEELATNLANETTARETADTAINQRIDNIINSPDVRYIVDTYADLGKIDKSTVGDQDYARVLVDETHEGQSSYYQFSKATNTWNFIGTVGDYYTKTEANNTFATITTVDGISTKVDGISTKVDDVDAKIGDIQTALDTLNTGAGV